MGTESLWNGNGWQQRDKCGRSGEAPAAVGGDNLFVLIYRIYTLTKFGWLMEKCGFEITNAFGDFRGSELSRESLWMIVQSFQGLKFLASFSQFTP